MIDSRLPVGHKVRLTENVNGDDDDGNPFYCDAGNIYTLAGRDGGRVHVEEFTPNMMYFYEGELEAVPHAE